MKRGLQSAEIHGREKRPFSIWRKMKTKNVGFEQLSDIIAFRIVTDNVAQCYQALGVIHAEWHTIHSRPKDYISTPKSNGYQSLHAAAVLGPGQQRVEIQIRTHEMDEIAEYGLAAHWAYKQAHKDKATYAIRTASSFAGCASSSRFSKNPRTPRNSWKTPSSRCIRTRCSPLPAKGGNVGLSPRRDAGRFRLCGTGQRRRYVRRCQN